MDLYRLMFVVSVCSVRTDDIIIRTIKNQGYEAELHTVITDDAYILNVHRIRPPKPTSRIALLMHGLQINGFLFVYPRRQHSIAFDLADNGYDVWIGNARGTEFSRKHQTLHPNSAEFWDFSFHEIAAHDLPAIIDHILTTTKQTALHYVGNSQGATIIVALLALKPEYNRKMLTLHLMTPVIFVRNVMPSWYRNLGSIFDGVVDTMDSMDISREIFIVDDSTRKKCADMCNIKSHLTYSLCKNYYFLLAGPTEQWNDVMIQMNRIDSEEKLFINTTDLFHHIPNSISLRQILHYVQLFRDGKGRFLQYDYKHEKNLHLYNRTEPPEYNLRNVRAKIHILYGTTDHVANYKDVEVVIDLFRPLIIGIDRMDGWNHGDFLMAKNLGAINKKIMKLMKQYS